MRRITITFLLTLLLFWVAYGLLNAESIMHRHANSGMSMSFAAAFGRSALRGFALMPFMLGLIALTQYFPIRRDRLLRNLSILSLGCAATIVLRALLLSATNPWLGTYPEPFTFGEIVGNLIRNELLFHWMMIGIGHALLYARHAQERELRIAKLESGLNEARLQALSAQLNPHFLFNTLNAIAEQMHHDVRAADRMLVGLSTLLRRSLEGTASQEISLREELEMLDHYLDIQRARLGDRLRLTQTIAPGCLDAGIPALLLQPLVENAIVHAIAPRPEGGYVRIRAHRDGDRLHLSVEDDGGVEAPAGSEHAQLEHARPGHGIGLRNTVDRLHCLHEDRFDFDLATTPGVGTCVRIALPYRAVPDMTSGDLRPTSETAPERISA